MEGRGRTGIGGRPVVMASVAAGVVALTVYWLTCHRTITWWDSAPYTTAAATLGVVGPPGSLLLTLLGWLVTRLPLGLPSAFILNLFAGFLAATTVALTAYGALLVSAVANGGRDHPSGASGAGGVSISRMWLGPVAAAAAALSLAFSPTTWTYATTFAPYILTAAFTGLLLVTLVRWWHVASHDIGARWLFLIALLIGLDFSVHRTNALLVPGILLWVLIRRPGVVASVRAWGAGIGGLLSGLSLQLLLVPIAGRAPEFNMSDPSSLGRLWSYVSLEQMGGGFLFNLFPRRADFWSHQLGDVWEALRLSFAVTDGALFVLGVVPLLLGGYGLYSVARRSLRLGVGLMVLFITTVFATVVYFNIPETYFRPLHRHYLPCLVMLALLSATGAVAVAERLATLRGRRGVALAGSTIALIAAVAVGRISDNYTEQNRSRNYFACDYATNLLNYLPPDSILLTAGDNDTFPLWYLQIVERVRRDVSVVNIPLLNTSWYVENVLCTPGGVAFSRPAAEIAHLQPKPWQAREIAVAYPTSQPATTDADSLRIKVGPTVGEYVLPQDQVALDMVRSNWGKRPIFVATTVPPSSLPWLRDHLSLEGLAYRLVQTADPEPDVAALESNVLEKYTYRGYADPMVYIDNTSSLMAQNLVAAFLTLAGEQSPARCHEIRRRMESVLPLDRLRPAESLLAQASAVCDSP